jgi:Zn-dependent peptidase ImmA (M78 family)/DNA-binding XRE family transcriptional regulator
MPNELFSPQRLTLARQRRGLFIQELAARVGVNVKTVTRWEKGEKEPEPTNVDALARVLEFPREFFFGDTPPLLDDGAFRSLAKMTARQRSMALAAGSQAVALDMYISEKFKRPSPNLLDLRGYSPQDAADAVRAQWGLGYKPVPNLVHTLEKNGIRVYSLVHEGGEIDGFSTWQGESPYIFLNTTKTAERSRMDAAHELAHLVLHLDLPGPAGRAEEEEARSFASCFLMPGPAFVASAPRRINLPAVLDAKRLWGVSASAYVYRLYGLGRLSEWQNRSLNIQIKTAFPRSEPGEPMAREASQVLAKVLASSVPGTSRKEMAKHLRIRMSDLDEMTFGLALTPVAGEIRPAAPTSPSRGRPSIGLVR